MDDLIRSGALLLGALAILIAVFLSMIVSAATLLVRGMSRPSAGTAAVLFVLFAGYLLTGLLLRRLRIT